MTYILIDLVDDNTEDKNDSPLIVVLVTEEYHKHKWKVTARLSAAFKMRLLAAQRLLQIILI